MSKTSLWRHLLLDAIIPPSLSESIFTPFQSVTKPPASSKIGILAAISCQDKIFSITKSIKPAESKAN